MPTEDFETDELLRQRGRLLPKAAVPERGRIGSGVALANPGAGALQKDNPHHWQTLIFLLPLLHNPDTKGHRKPIAPFLIERTLDEMRGMFSGFTITRAMGWYWDEGSSMGIPDDLVRFEVDGVFNGNDLRALHEWKKTLRRRFRQDYIYMRLVASGTAI